MVSDLVFENVREGIVIESEGDNENYVVLSGLVFDGIYNSSSGSSDNFEYAILGENGRANVIAVNNTIKAPSTFGGQFNHKTAGIYLYGSCSFVGFNHLVGNFGPAILLNVDQTETPCDFDPAADNNSISLEAISYPDAFWLSGANVRARNNLIYRGDYGYAFYLRQMTSSLYDNPLENNYLGFNSNYCTGFGCDWNQMCGNFQSTCGFGSSSCCSQYCTIGSDPNSGCISAEQVFNGLNEEGCVENSDNFGWVDSGTTVVYPDVIQDRVPAVNGQERDIGAREKGVPFSVGDVSAVCE